MRLHPLFLALILAVPAAAQTRPEHHGAPTEPIRDEVARLNQEMVAAFHRGDARSVAAFYSDSARIVGPRRRVVTGRAAIDAYWAAIGRPATWSLQVVNVGGTRDEAFQVGVSTLTSPGGDGRPETYTCDFVAVWRRESDGRLRMVLDFYN